MVTLLIYLSPVNLMTSLRKSQRQRYFSDHAVVLCHPRRAKPTSTVRHSEFRKLRAIEKKNFWRTSIRTSSLCRDPPDTLEGLVECCNDTLSTLLDKHAPVRPRHITTSTQ